MGTRLNQVQSDLELNFEAEADGRSQPADDVRGVGGGGLDNRSKE